MEKIDELRITWLERVALIYHGQTVTPEPVDLVSFCRNGRRKARRWVAEGAYCL